MFGLGEGRASGVPLRWSRVSGPVDSRPGRPVVLNPEGPRSHLHPSPTGFPPSLSSRSAQRRGELGRRTGLCGTGRREKLGSRWLFSGVFKLCEFLECRLSVYVAETSHFVGADKWFSSLGFSVILYSGDPSDSWGPHFVFKTSL